MSNSGLGFALYEALAELLVEADVLAEVEALSEDEALVEVLSEEEALNEPLSEVEALVEPLSEDEALNDTSFAVMTAPDGDAAWGEVAAIVIGRMPVEGAADVPVDTGEMTGGGVEAADGAGDGEFAGWAADGIGAPTPPPATGTSAGPDEGRPEGTFAEASVIAFAYRPTSTGTAVASGAACGMAAVEVVTTPARPPPGVIAARRAGLNDVSAETKASPVRAGCCPRTDVEPISAARVDAATGNAVARLDTGQIASRLSAEGRKGRSFRGGYAWRYRPWVRFIGWGAGDARRGDGPPGASPSNIGSIVDLVIGGILGRDAGGRQARFFLKDRRLLRRWG